MSLLHRFASLQPWIVVMYLAYVMNKATKNFNLETQLTISPTIMNT